MRSVREHLMQVARSPVPVLIQGETGTGKELCARAIVHLSGTRNCVAVNCAAFTESLVDSELFGYTRGAFTGATHDRPGLVATADGGVLFLDELPELPLRIQAKLLRTLECGEYRPVGSTKSYHSCFRIIAATTTDVDTLAAAGRLRVDLVHRLGAVRISLPPLRQRLDDIPDLCIRFLKEFTALAGSGPGDVTVTRDAVDLLQQHTWPGNVRELRNVIEAAATLVGSAARLKADHLYRVLRRSNEPSSSEPALTFVEAMRAAERGILQTALSEADGNRARAAALLGISEATLYRKLARLRS